MHVVCYCLYVACLYVCLPACLWSVCCSCLWMWSVCVSICTAVIHLSQYLYVRVYQSVICMLVCPSVICLSICISVCVLVICVYLSQSVCDLYVSVCSPLCVGDPLHLAQYLCTPVICVPVCRCHYIDLCVPVISLYLSIYYSMCIYLRSASHIICVCQ